MPETSKPCSAVANAPYRGIAPNDSRDTHAAVVPAPIGSIALRVRGSALTGVEILSHPVPPVAPTTTVAINVMDQIMHYFETGSWRIEVPVDLNGTAFQQLVWQALRDIPAGEVLTYGALARRLGSGARAVGNACRANPVPLVVPCHRVVAANGEGGFMGATDGTSVSIKRWLLAHERRAAG